MFCWESQWCVAPICMCTIVWANYVLPFVLTWLTVPMVFFCVPYRAFSADTQFATSTTQTSVEEKRKSLPTQDTDPLTQFLTASVQILGIARLISHYIRLNLPEVGKCESLSVQLNAVQSQKPKQCPGRHLMASKRCTKCLVECCAAALPSLVSTDAKTWDLRAARGRGETSERRRQSPDTAAILHRWILLFARYWINILIILSLILPIFAVFWICMAGSKFNE